MAQKAKGFVLTLIVALIAVWLVENTVLGKFIKKGATNA